MHVQLGALLDKDEATQVPPCVLEPAKAAYSKINGIHDKCKAIIQGSGDEEPPVNDTKENNYAYY